MDNTILTPGQKKIVKQTPIQKEKYLTIDKFLTEYDNPGKKALIRDNINVYSKEDVYSKDEFDTHLSEELSEVINSHLELNDPHNIIPKIQTFLYDFIKKDGTVPFSKPQKGVEPINKNHLATKGYVDKVLHQHMIDNNSHNILAQIQEKIRENLLIKSANNQEETCSKKEVTKLLNTYKATNTKKFNALYNDLKSYIDSEIKSLISKIEEKESEENKPEVYTKEETYSKQEILGVMKGMLDDMIVPTITSYLKKMDELLSILKKKLGMSPNFDLSIYLKLIDEYIDKLINKYKNELSSTVNNYHIKIDELLNDFKEKLNSYKNKLDTYRLKLNSFNNRVTIDEVIKLLDDNIDIILNELDGLLQGTGFEKQSYRNVSNTHYLKDSTNIIEALLILDNELYKISL